MIHTFNLNTRKFGRTFAVSGSLCLDEKGMLNVLEENGFFSVIDPNTDEVEHFKINHYFEKKPSFKKNFCVSNGFAYIYASFGDFEGEVCALDIENKRIVWSHHVENRTLNSISIVDSTLYCAGDKLYAFKEG